MNNGVKNMDKIRNEIKEKIKKEGNEREGEYKGYKYKIYRGEVFGNWVGETIYLRGYVALPEGHTFPLEKRSIHGYDENAIENFIIVHGGITYSGRKEFSDGEHYCLGFDTAHSGDMFSLDYPITGKYRDMEYVENECKHIIDQLILAEHMLKGMVK